MTDLRDAAELCRWQRGREVCGETVLQTGVAKINTENDQWSWMMDVVADIKRGRAARNAKLASLPVGMAGRAALGFGKRLTGKSKDEVNAELMEKAANQLFTVLGELKGGR